MNKDQKFLERYAELKPMIFCIQAAIELFGREKARELAKVAFEKYSIDRFVMPLEDIPLQERWPAWRDNLIEHADGSMYSLDKHDENMIKIKYTRCTFLDVFRDAGLEDFVPMYCEMDYLTCQLIDPRIVMTRTQILAEGAPFCDHFWEFKTK